MGRERHARSRTDQALQGNLLVRQTLILDEGLEAGDHQRDATLGHQVELIIGLGRTDYLNSVE
jgi:hypothetical protein